ncbi:MAG: MOSC domain-containing protein [Aureispira sp.]|nr:MOSC domain-containing protein [Aureispira sp.]
MNLLSVNTGTKRRVEWKGKELSTGIFKTAVDEPILLKKTHVQNDEQADLKNHGGEYKAVYSYDQSYYDYWKTILDRTDWSYGLFGENLTTQGMLDKDVKVGNIYKVGEAIIQAIQPRIPCFKLNIRFGIDNMVDQFYAAAYHGIYYKVLQEGLVEAGDSIVLEDEYSGLITIQDIVSGMISRGKADLAKTKIIAEHPLLPERIKGTFSKFL